MLIANLIKIFIMRKFILLITGLFVFFSVIGQNLDTIQKTDYQKYVESKEKGLVKDTVYLHDTIYAEQQQPEENSYTNNDYELGFGYPFFFGWYYNWYSPWYSPYYYNYGWNNYTYFGYGRNRPYWHRPHHLPYNRYYASHPYVPHNGYRKYPQQQRSAYGLSTTRIYRQNNTQIYERPRANVNVRPEYNTSRATIYNRQSSERRAPVSRSSNYTPSSRPNYSDGSSNSRPSNNSNNSSGSRSSSNGSYGGGSSSRSYSAPSGGGSSSRSYSAPSNSSNNSSSGRRR
jgi:hypothetical protein